MKKPKPPTDRPRCRECPLFEPTRNTDGEHVTAPLTDDKGERITRNGIPLFWKHLDGGFVKWGMCGARLPEQHPLMIGDRLQRVGTSMREVRSDWFCESKEKHEALARLDVAAWTTPKGKQHG